MAKKMLWMVTWKRSGIAGYLAAKMKRETFTSPTDANARKNELTLDPFNRHITVNKMEYNSSDPTIRRKT